MKKKIKQIIVMLKSLRFRFKHIKNVKNWISNSNIKNESNLEKNQKKEIADFWGEYNRHIRYEWHNLYYSVNGIFSPHYIPEDFFHSVLVHKLGKLSFSMVYSDKNMYDKYYNDVLKPRMIIRCINGKYYDFDYNIKTYNMITKLLFKENSEFIIKPTVGSSQGKGVEILRIKDNKLYLQKTSVSLNEITQLYKDNFIIQEIVSQNKLLDKLYPNSLNTIRIMTIYLNGKYEVISSVLRLGNKGSHVDNFSVSGIAIGINSDGSLKEMGVDKKLNTYYQHPETEVVFKDVKLPNFEKALQMAKKLHEKTYYFNLASWDLAINEDGEYVFIEANLGAQGINIHQLTNGPLFGSSTEEVLNSIFK